MDMVRSCYYSRMKYFRDNLSISIPGRWHFCEPGAKPVPFAHIYASKIWDDEISEFQGGLGEQLGQSAYSKGSGDPDMRGQRVCGGAFVWQHGALESQRGAISINADGIPDCCAPGTRVVGGGVSGGSSPVFYESPILSEGGLLGNGAGDFGVGFAGLGGLLGNGAGDFGVGFAGLGGLLGNGAGDFSYGVVEDDSARLAIRFEDLVSIPFIVDDSIRVAVRITDAVVLNPFSADDTIRIAVRITDAVSINPLPADDTIRIAVRITDSVSINPLPANDTIRIAVRITDSVTTS